MLRALRRGAGRHTLRRLGRIRGLLPELLGAVAVAAAAFALPPASAHEFWAESVPARPQRSDQVRVRLLVGEYFSGERAGFTLQHAQSVRLHSAPGVELDLSKRLPKEDPIPELLLPPLAPGTHLLSYDSYPSVITLAPDKFNAYLHEEGLDHVIRQREAQGQSDASGRERYRRNVKHLIRVGMASDGTYGKRTGQRLEIVPGSDPFLSSRSKPLDFVLQFDGKALPGALVKAMHKTSGQVTIMRARTNDAGRVRLTLPFNGTWMVSAVHMIRATDTSEADWDSYWANLTFHLPGAGR